LILYGGHRSDVDDDDDDAVRTDFIAIELLDGRLRYVFDVGSGVRVIRDRLQRPLNDNRWHEVTIRPNEMKTTEVYDRWQSTTWYHLKRC